MAGPKGNAVIGQSGGPTAVINRSFIGALKEATPTYQPNCLDHL